jgi:hypothetical protein
MNSYPAPQPHTGAQPRTVWAVVGAVLAIAGAVLVLLGALEGGTSLDPYQGWTRVDATVTDVSRTLGTGHPDGGGAVLQYMYTPTMRFTVDGSAQTYVGDSGPTEYAVGQVVPLVYPPGDPTQAKVAPTSQNTQTPTPNKSLLIGGVAAFVVGGCLVGWCVVGRRRSPSNRHPNAAMVPAAGSL